MPELSKGTVKIVSGGSTYPPYNCNTDRVLDGWDNAKFQFQGVDTSLPLASYVTISFLRGADSLEAFKGEIVTRRNMKTGQDLVTWEYQAYGPFFEASKKAIAIGETVEVDTVALARYLSYTSLVGDYTKCPGESISIDKNDAVNVSDAIENLCKNSSISFYTSPGGTVYFFKGDYNTTSTSLSVLLSKERISSIESVKNYLRIYGVDTKYEGTDKYTESTVGWSVKYKPDMFTGWTSSSLGISTYNPQEGTYSVRSKIGEGETEYAVYMARSIDPLTLATDIGIKVKFAIGNLYKSGYLIPPLLAGHPRMYVLLSQYDLSNPDSFPGYIFTQWDPGEIGGVNWDSSISWTSKNITIKDEYGTMSPDWNVEGDYGTVLQWISFYLAGGGAYGRNIAVDGLHFSRYAIVDVYNANTISYGIRQHVPSKSYYKDLSTSQLQSTGYKELSKVSEAEESVRDLILEGTSSVYLGYRYTITLDNETKSFQVKEINDEFDGSDWKTKLVLSSSPARNPIRERAQKSKEVMDEVVKLKRRANLMDEDFNNVTFIINNPEVEVPDYSYWNGSVSIGSFNINVASGGSFGISKIDNIGTMSANLINSIGVINTIGTANIGTIGTVGSISAGYMSVGTINTVGVLNANVANISQISSIATFTAGIVNASVLGSIGTATIGILTSNTISGVNSLSVGILNANTLGSIGTATITNLWSNSIGGIGTLTLTNLFATNASIGVISNTLTNLNAITAIISTINSIQNLNVINASINALSGGFSLGAGNIADLAINIDKINFVLPTSGYGLVLDMPFDDDAKDYSSNDNNGSISGASFTTGKFGNALYFDGINDYVQVPNTSTLNVTRITMMAWVKRGTIAASTWPRPIGKENQYFWWVDSSGAQCLGIYIGGTIHDVYTYDPIAFPVLPINEWHHVAMTYDGTYVVGYYDGVQYIGESATGNIDSGTFPLKIGYISSYFFKGTIDEVRIYNRALSEDEIKSVYMGFRERSHYVSGNQIVNFNIDAGNIGNLTVGTISNTINNLNVITANIGTIANVNNLVCLYANVNGTLVANAGTIVNIYGTSINYNVGTITNFLSGTISGNSIQFNIGTITTFMAGTISGNSVQFNIGTVTNFQAGTISGNSISFNIGTITSFQTGTISGNSIGFNIGTITSFQAGTIFGNSLSFNIGTLTNFQAGTITGNSIKFNIGTITNMQVGTLSGNSVGFNIGSISNLVISSATINNIDLNAGTIDNVLFQNSTLNFTNITNTGNLVIGSSSISTLSLISIASNNVIQNNNINTLTISYDRLVKPPIGWNEIVNPGFEYGRWGSGLGTSSTVESHSGSRCYRVATTNTVETYEDYPSYINMAGASSFILSIWWKGTVPGTSPGISFWYVKASDALGTGGVYGGEVNTGGVFTISTWTQAYGTFTVDPAKPFIKPSIYSRGGGTFCFDDCMIVKGNQLTSFVDNTTARDRWMPDFYYSKEINTINSTVAAGTAIFLTCTLDYNAKAIIFSGCNASIHFLSPPPQYYDWSIYVDGTSLNHIFIKEKYNYDRCDNITMIEDTILTTGIHTISLRYGASCLSSLDMYERYIRVITGSYFG
jgi:hypothetical protein